MTTRKRESGEPSPEKVALGLKGDPADSQIKPEHISVHASLLQLIYAERQARDWLAFIVATKGVNRRAGR